MATALIHPMTRPTRRSSSYLAAKALVEEAHAVEFVFRQNPLPQRLYLLDRRGQVGAVEPKQGVRLNRSATKGLGLDWATRRQESRPYGMAHIHKVEILDYADHRHRLAIILGKRQGAAD